MNSSDARWSLSARVACLGGSFRRLTIDSQIGRDCGKWKRPWRRVGGKHRARISIPCRWTQEPPPDFDLSRGADADADADAPRALEGTARLYNVSHETRYEPGERRVLFASQSTCVFHRFSLSLSLFSLSLSLRQRHRVCICARIGVSPPTGPLRRRRRRREGGAGALAFGMKCREVPVSQAPTRTWPTCTSSATRASAPTGELFWCQLPCVSREFRSARVRGPKRVCSSSKSSAGSTARPRPRPRPRAPAHPISPYNNRDRATPKWDLDNTGRETRSHL